MAEAMLIAKRSGLDLVEFWHAIRMSAGNSFLWETCGPNVFRGEYHDSFPIGEFELELSDSRPVY